MAGTGLDPQTIARRDAELARMIGLLDDALGAGLAATQLGVLHRVFVSRAEPDAPIQAFVNPRLEWAGEEVDADEEGCLSIPGIWVEVERPVHVRMSGFDARGRPRIVETEGLEARVLQHELDHLDGVLMLDRASREHRREAMRALRE